MHKILFSVHLRSGVFSVFVSNLKCYMVKLVKFVIEGMMAFLFNEHCGLKLMRKRISKELGQGFDG